MLACRVARRFLENGFVWNQASRKVAELCGAERYLGILRPVVQEARCCSTLATENTISHPVNDVTCITCDDEQIKETVLKDMLIYNDFISPEEEESLLNEVEPYMKRLRYEYDHWDDAIHGYRETERGKWTQKNKVILQRVRDLAFPPGKPQMTYVHVLDLAKEGYIKAHIDSVRFCGSVIAGLSLLSTSVMRLVNDADKTKYADVLLRRRSLYIMRGRARYDFSHEVLGEDKSFFKGEAVPRDRRISVICRCDVEPGAS